MNSNHPHWSAGGTSTHSVESAGSSIRINLTVPQLRVGFGMFTLDPITQLLGMPLSEVLAALMVAPMYQRRTISGVQVDVYPLALPEGEGASIRLGQLAEVGFANDHGLLRLIVPWSVSGWVQQRMAAHIVHGPQQVRSADGLSWLAQVWVKLEPGMASSIPLGSWGELGVEAG